MERGPLALFGAVIAVGLGPAMWLGAQLGAVHLAPGQRPGSVDEQFPGADMDFGGAGAGDPADDAPVITYSYPPPAESSPVPRLVATDRPSPARTVQPRPPASLSPWRPVSPSTSVSSRPSEEPSLEPSTGGPPTIDPSTNDSAGPSASADPGGTPGGETSTAPPPE